MLFLLCKSNGISDVEIAGFGNEPEGPPLLLRA